MAPSGKTAARETERRCRHLLSNAGDGAATVKRSVLNAAGVDAPLDLEVAGVAPRETPAVGDDPVPAARFRGGSGSREEEGGPHF